MKTDELATAAVRLHFPEFPDLLSLLVHLVFHQHPDVFTWFCTCALAYRRARLCVFRQKIGCEVCRKSSVPPVLLVSALLDAIRSDWILDEFKNQIEANLRFGSFN